ncbi:hypothetical protein MASR1M107_12720 [Ignavibacteriales bacterium]
MFEVAMYQRREDNSKKVVGISRRYSEPGKRKTCKILGKLDYPKDSDKERGNSDCVTDPVPDDLKIQNISSR